MKRWYRTGVFDPFYSTDGALRYVKKRSITTSDPRINPARKLLQYMRSFFQSTERKYELCTVYKQFTELK